MELDQRKKQILYAVIKTYLETGEPVGSRTLSKFVACNYQKRDGRFRRARISNAAAYIGRPYSIR